MSRPIEGMSRFEVCCEIDHRRKELNLSAEDCLKRMVCESPVAGIQDLLQWLRGLKPEKGSRKQQDVPGAATPYPASQKGVRANVGAKKRGLRKISEAPGIDITGGLDSVEYVRRIRNGDIMP